MATDRKIEVEAKYRILSPGAGDRYLVAPEIGPLAGQGAVRSLRIEDRYVDTATWDLARAGFAARLRKTPRGIEIGLKSRNAASGSVHRREEIEGPADLEALPKAWPPSSARDVVLELCGDRPLVEVVTLRQLRRVRTLQAGDSTAELSLDEVSVVDRGDVVDTFEELEVELKSDDETVLPAVVAILDADPELKPQGRSKFERGVKAIRSRLGDRAPEDLARWELAPDDLLPGKKDPKPKPPKAEKADGNAKPAEGTSGEPARTRKRPNKPDARTIGLQGADSMPEAARKVLDFHFRRLKNREAGTRNGADPEELHDMRVAARRMRAAWRVFDGSFKPARTRKLRRRLGVLADRLGSVRDLDVLLQNVEAYRAEMDEASRPGLDPLISLWRRQRNGARAQLIDELNSREFLSFVEDMDDFLESGANSAARLVAPTAPHRVRDRAASEIWATYEAVRVYELVLPWADIETLHDLRISTKWLRYCLEFFGELLGPDADRLLTRVAALQDHLGYLHDADAAAKLARDVLVARAGELSRTETAAIGGYLQSREREVARRRRALGPVWRAVNGAPFRRALGRATASL